MAFRRAASVSQTVEIDQSESQLRSSADESRIGVFLSDQSAPVLLHICEAFRVTPTATLLRRGFVECGVHHLLARVRAFFVPRCFGFSRKKACTCERGDHSL